MNTAILLVLSIPLIVVVIWFLFPIFTAKRLLRIIRNLTGLKKRTIIINGIRWVYLDTETVEKPTIVLVHGYGGNKDNWLTYTGLLRKKYRVIVPDLPGFGDSAKDFTLDYSMDAQAERLHQFIEVLNIPRVHIAGNSMGGGISGFYALKYPKGLLSLTFLNSVGVFPESQETRGELGTIIESNKNALLATTMEELNRLFDLATFKPQKIPLPIKKLALKEMIENHDLLEKIFQHLVNNKEDNELTPLLPKITTPTLVLWGGDDRIINVACAHTKAEKIPNSRLVILNKVGHMPMIESPKETAMHHLAFMERL